uniref:Uncharacterized protein ycf20 n=1 Tax=Hildenbrandia rivularis TaxID=135206 RepID=A0A1C9CFK1_9FLOR|nr:hypothetical protein Hrvl_084 [Hildenbrandia rivularis]AOM67144.1 hypothetical protein Hrvl_084 [Hildenbrandia rivularis]
MKVMSILRDVILRIINLLLGFFLATVFSTLPGQTGDWTIVGSGVIVSLLEYLSWYIYTENYIKSSNFSFVNELKIGIMYGLFVDSFKLGS